MKAQFSKPLQKIDLQLAPEAESKLPVQLATGLCDVRMVVLRANLEGSEMDEMLFQKKLSELMSEITTLPKSEREKLTALAEQTQERHKKLKKTVSDLQESLDYLRLSIKYLVFDLEATRRENAYLRKMLEQDQAEGGPEDLPGTP